MLNRLFRGSRRTNKDTASSKSADFDVLEKKLEDPCAKPIPLPLEYLKSITRDFSQEQELGRGGFGVVYKGVFQNGKLIAVKKLSDMHLDNDQFNNEVTYLIEMKHENIVQLMGYCSESQSEAIQVSGKYVMAEKWHRLICFEYLTNKSLDKHLSDESSGLEWHIRYKIIKGICCGLHYLHKEWHIVHLDLKPANILMDDNMVPKIADFGMSRLFGQQQSRIITDSRGGTFGYMAPEYLTNGLISTKSDIFSLGAIIIELLIGSKDYPRSTEASYEHFIENVVNRWRNRLEKSSKYIPLEVYCEQVSACIKIGMKCVDPDRNKRPPAWDILEMLNATETESNMNAHSGVNGGQARDKTPPASMLPCKTANVWDYYRIGKILGKGHFAITYHCVSKADGAEYACKSIRKGKDQSDEEIYLEIQIMHHLSEHPNVVRIYGAYEDKRFVHIIMELCTGGELFDRIVAKGHYSERAAANLIKTIVGFIEECHSLGVIHRDIKPENFLFDSTAEEAPLKVTDFGLSTFYKHGDKFRDVVGTPYYVAPELLRGRYGPEVDVWSAGVILYILLCGVPPFWAATENGIFEEVLHGKLDFESEPWPSISDSAKDLVSNMLTRDPEKRFSAHEVLCHPWIDDAVAPDKPIDSAVLPRLQHFSATNKLKKMALMVIAASLSDEEIKGLKEVFMTIDTDSSGTITFDELKVGLKRVGSELTENEIQALMEEADVDNSGTIDYVEFIAATLRINKLEREESLVSAFTFFDKDGSGFITIDELSQACQEFGIDDADLEDMIKDIDQNNDGKIDYSEFTAMMRKGNAGEAGRRTIRNSLHLNLGELLNPSKT